MLGVPASVMGTPAAGLWGLWGPLGVSLNERVADAIWGGTEPTKWTRILTAQTSLRWGDLCLAPCPHSTPAERALVLLRGSAPDMGGPVREHEGGEARDWAALPA